MTKDYAFDKSSREDVLTLREMLSKQYPDADISVDFKDDNVNLHIDTDDEDIGKSIVADIEHNIYGPSDDEFDNVATLKRVIDEGWSEDDIRDVLTQICTEYDEVEPFDIDESNDDVAQRLQEAGVDIAPYLNADNRLLEETEKLPSEAVFDDMFEQYMAFREASGEENAKEALHYAAADAGVQLDEDAGGFDWIKAILKEGGDPSAYFNADNFGPLEDEEDEGEGGDGDGDGLGPYFNEGDDFDPTGSNLPDKKPVGKSSLIDQIKALSPEERKELLAQLSDDKPQIPTMQKKQSSALAKLIGNMRF